MRGGDRRSPPLTRKSSGGEVPRFVFPPARVNAGFNAVMRGPDGKFLSNSGRKTVQNLIEAINERASGSLVGGSSSMEEGEMIPTDASEVGGGPSSDTGAARQQPMVVGVNGVLGLEPEIQGVGLPVRPDPHPHPSPSPIPSDCAVAGSLVAVSMVGACSSNECPAGVCLNDNKKNSCTSAGISVNTAPIMMDGDCHMPPASSPTLPHPSPEVGGCLDGDEIMGTSSPPAVQFRDSKLNSCTSAGKSFYYMGNTTEVGCDVPPPPSPNLPPSFGAHSGAAMDDDMGDPSSSLGVDAAARIRDSNFPFHSGDGNSAWNKPGATPLPSLKDLPHLQPLNGAARLDEEESTSYISRFDGALVGRLFGRHIPFFHLNVELRRRWDRFGKFKLMTLSNECFICFFDEPRARDAVLMGGPWYIAGQVIGLDRWTPGFSPSTTHGFITPIWVRLPELPFYCWGVRNLASISSLLGEPLWVDDATLNMSKGAYARVCIKMDLSRPLLPTVSIIGRDGTFCQQVEYEGLTAFCTKCGRVGHKVIHCNPTLAAGGRPDASKKTHPIMNKMKSVGHAPIFGFSATKASSGKVAAAHVASSSKMSNPFVASEPTPMPQDGEDLGGAGPWKVVPTRRRGRRLKQKPMPETTASRPTVSSHSPPVGEPVQVHEPPQHHMDSRPLPDVPERQLPAQADPVQHDTGGNPPTTFTYSSAPFSLGTWEGGPPPPPFVDTYTSNIPEGKQKKRRAATSTDVEDASSIRPP